MRQLQYLLKTEVGAAWTSSGGKSGDHLMKHDFFPVFLALIFVKKLNSLFEFSDIICNFAA